MDNDNAKRLCEVCNLPVEPSYEMYQVIRDGIVRFGHFKCWKSDDNAEVGKRTDAGRVERSLSDLRTLEKTGIDVARINHDYAKLRRENEALAERVRVLENLALVVQEHALNLDIIKGILVGVRSPLGPLVIQDILDALQALEQPPLDPMKEG